MIDGREGALGAADEATLTRLAPRCCVVTRTRAASRTCCRASGLSLARGADRRHSIPRAKYDRSLAGRHALGDLRDGVMSDVV